MQSRLILLVVTRPRLAVTYCTKTSAPACDNAIFVHPERHMLLLLNLTQTKTP